MTQEARMLTAARRLLMAPFAMLVVGLFATGLAGAAPQDASASAVMSRQAFHDAMRTLWAGDHIVWTRCYIVSAATLPENLPDTGATADRLLFNQTEIGNAIKPFYGDAAGNALTALLRVHILTAVELIADANGPSRSWRRCSTGTST